MRTKTRVATTIAAGVVATALLASPSLAAGRGESTDAGPGTPSTRSAQPVGTCDGTGIGTRAGAGQGTGAGVRGGQNGQGITGQGRGAGMGAGTHADLTGVATGTLTDTQKAALAAMAEEEKVAHDLYVAFANAYTTPVFTRIAKAETQHLTEIRVVLDRYDITDPTADQAAGTFTTASFQQLYDAQLAAGKASLEAAYAAGHLIESTDIADLKSARTDVTAPDVLQVYTNLLAGSQRHLTAFGG